MKIKTIIVLLACLVFSSAYANRIKIYGHRGARGLSPENSIPAYKTGLAIGIDVVDMDVNMTKDKVVVVTHDQALNSALTSKNGRWIDASKIILIKDLTYKQLQQYDIGRLHPDAAYGIEFPDQVPVDGTHISSLRDVIEYVKKHGDKDIGFQVEIKTDPNNPDWGFSPKEIARATVKVLQEEGVDGRTELQAFDWRVLQEVQKIDPKIATAYLTDNNIATNMSSPNPTLAGLWSAGLLLKNYNNSIPYMIKKLGGKIWGPESIQLTAENVNEAHLLGLKVVPWTVDTPADIKRMINLGVDGIITDRPDIVRGIMSAEGLPVRK